MHYLFIIFTILFSVNGVANAYCPPIDEPAIQKIIEQSRVKYQIPGVAVTINCPSEHNLHEFTAGFGKINEEPLTNDHLFQVGSITKSFIAVLMLQLEAEGSLSIDDSISRWLPNLKDKWQSITIKQLLNHSSGIYNYTDTLIEKLKEDKLDLYYQWSSDELLGIAKNKPLYFTPGDNFHYSNTNYVIAGMIIEVATGHSLEYELNARLIQPLQLKNTFYLPLKPNEQQLKRMSHGYSENGNFSDEPHDITDANLSWANAAGSIITNSHDLAIWFMSLMHGDILPPSQMSELMQTIPTNGSLPNASPDNSYGLGVMHDPKLFSKDIWWHTGGTLGYSTFILWLKESDIVLTLTLNNAHTNSGLYRLTESIVNILEDSKIA